MLEDIILDHTKKIDCHGYTITANQLNCGNFNLFFNDGINLTKISLVRNSHISTFKYKRINENCLFSNETGSGKSWKIALIALDQLLQNKSVTISYPTLLADQIDQTFLQLIPQNLFEQYKLDKLIFIDHNKLLKHSNNHHTDLLIIDEAHLCFNNEKSNILMEQLSKKIRTVFFTASPTTPLLKIATLLEYSQRDIQAKYIIFGDIKSNALSIFSGPSDWFSEVITNHFYAGAFTPIHDLAMKFSACQEHKKALCIVDKTDYIVNLYLKYKIKQSVVPPRNPSLFLSKDLEEFSSKFGYQDSFYFQGGMFRSGFKHAVQEFMFGISTDSKTPNHHFRDKIQQILFHQLNDHLDQVNKNYHGNIHSYLSNLVPLEHQNNDWFKQLEECLNDLFSQKEKLSEYDFIKEAISNQSFQRYLQNFGMITFGFDDEDTKMSNNKIYSDLEVSEFYTKTNPLGMKHQYLHKDGVATKTDRKNKLTLADKTNPFHTNFEIRMKDNGISPQTLKIAFKLNLIPFVISPTSELGTGYDDRQLDILINCTAPKNLYEKSQIEGRLRNNGHPERYLFSYASQQPKTAPVEINAQNESLYLNQLPNLALKISDAIIAKIEDDPDTDLNKLLLKHVISSLIEIDQNLFYDKEKTNKQIVNLTQKVSQNLQAHLRDIHYYIDIPKSIFLFTKSVYLFKSNSVNIKTLEQAIEEYNQNNSKEINLAIAKKANQICSLENFAKHYMTFDEQQKFILSKWTSTKKRPFQYLFSISNTVNALMPILDHLKPILGNEGLTFNSEKLTSFLSSYDNHYEEILLISDTPIDHLDHRCASLSEAMLMVAQSTSQTMSNISNKVTGRSTPTIPTVEEKIGQKVLNQIYYILSQITDTPQHLYPINQKTLINLSHHIKLDITYIYALSTYYDIGNIKQFTKTLDTFMGDLELRYLATKLINQLYKDLLKSSFFKHIKRLAADQSTHLLIDDIAKISVIFSEQEFKLIFGPNSGSMYHILRQIQEMGINDFYNQVDEVINEITANDIVSYLKDATQYSDSENPIKALIAQTMNNEKLFANHHLINLTCPLMYEILYAHSIKNPIKILSNMEKGIKLANRIHAENHPEVNDSLTKMTRKFQDLEAALTKQQEKRSSTLTWISKRMSHSLLTLLYCSFFNLLPYLTLNTTIIVILLLLPVHFIADYFTKKPLHDILWMSGACYITTKLIIACSYLHLSYTNIFILPITFLCSLLLQSLNTTSQKSNLDPDMFELSKKIYETKPLTKEQINQGYTNSYQVIHDQSHERNLESLDDCDFQSCLSS
ncbi:DEAD/DEAH box helicase family protein [Gammaproteobacteria bacterium]|nr:DEAD/DEAH box helicase family protein [Gammaproteobacteria bacterium]